MSHSEILCSLKLKQCVNLSSLKVDAAYKKNIIKFQYVTLSDTTSCKIKLNQESNMKSAMHGQPAELIASQNLLRYNNY